MAAYVLSLLLAQVYKPFSKSMLNRKMVFRVTKSQSMKDKLSFILYYMIILTGGWRVAHRDNSMGDPGVLSNFLNWVVL